ncbi:MAG TPA: adenylate/guanylate cyclase domain-containing protein [Leptospiraceae bacterium]|nr:adenylate/guanylate cyclase domain-containing protein [Leptospiraceae bacterium]
MSEGKISIVFAEDSAVQGVILKRILLEEGYEIYWGKTGKEALALIESKQPSLVISDVEMPDMNGFELCRTVKSKDSLKDIPVIICSSLSRPEDIMTGIECGADGYVTKPYDKKFLMYRVRTLLENPIHSNEEIIPIYINYAGKKFEITADRLHILNMLLTTYENSLKQYQELVNAQIELKKLNKSLDLSKKETENLLLNILPGKIAKELKEKGNTEPVFYDEATILFTDFKGFTKISEKLSTNELISHLDKMFKFFDSITQVYGIEKIKTIGDAYMCVAGIPEPSADHSVKCVKAALEIIDYMNIVNIQNESQGKPSWHIRIGIHTGPIVAGVVGTRKFCYDVWGDSVNTASRMESSGEPGRINISGSTFEKVKDYFECEYRGKIPAKNKGDIDMYFVNGVKKSNL